MVISNLVITHFSFDFGRNSGGFWNIDRSRVDHTFRFIERGSRIFLRFDFF